MAAEEGQGASREAGRVGLSFTVFTRIVIENCAGRKFPVAYGSGFLNGAKSGRRWLARGAKQAKSYIARFRRTAAFESKAVVATMVATSLLTPMDWSKIAPDFKYDGSLRDIYILGTSLVDWTRVWDVLTSSADGLSFRVDGETATPPTKVEAAFRLRGSHSVLASYALGKQRLNCHFFIEEQIEFDLDPRDVDGPVEAERLGQFLAVLGRATSKEVRLTPENAAEIIIARYDPTTDDVIWMPMTA